MSAPHVTAVLCGDRWSLRALYPLVKEGSTLGWIHVAMCGEWLGHPNGPFEFTRETFEQCVRNFDAQRNPVPLDYEHSTEYATEAPAAGWVHRLQVRDDPSGAALWALVEYTDKAAQYVRSGQYRFSSGVFAFGSIDRRSGENIGCRLTSLALTNTPYLDGQTPIALSQRAALAATEPSMEDMAHSKDVWTAALEAITSKGDITVEQLCQVAMGLAAQEGKTGEEEPSAETPPEMTDAALAADPSATPLADPTEPAAPMAPDPSSGDPSAMLGNKLMELTGLDASAMLAAIEQNADAIRAAFVGGAASQAPAPLADREREDHKLALSIRDDNVRRLSMEISDLRSKLAVHDKTDAERAIDALLADGKCTDKMRPELLALALSDRKRFDALAATLPQTVPVAPHAASVAPPADPNGTVAVDEADPFVRQLRANLTTAGVRGKAQDDAVRAGVSKRKSKN